MATTTSLLGLTKPEYTDVADVAVFNDNVDIIEKSIGARSRVDSLLDNGYFPSTHVINQRSWTSGTQVAASKYFIDRWMTGAAMSPTLSTAGIAVASGEIYQLLSRTSLIGKTLTAAICLSDGTVIAKSGVVPSDTAWANFINTTVNGTQIMLTNVDADLLRFRIFCNDNTVQWAALYEGAYAADNLPIFQPKGIAVETLNCQRYYYRVPWHAGLSYPGYSGSATEARVAIQTPIPMRIVPSVSIEDMTQSNIYAASGSHTISAVSVWNRDGNGVGLRLTTTGLTAWQPCVVRFSTSVALSADLQA